jgi:hypothetical protein
MNFAFLFTAAWVAVAAAGEAEIRARAGESEIVIRTTDRLAGAIDSLTWNGKEFIDSADHGRQLQSAANFDAGSEFTPETFNPTEAGSRADGNGSNSSSELLSLKVDGANCLETTSLMAFWLRPDEKSDGQVAKNTTIRSRHQLRKRVTIGYQGLPHVIHYEVVFTVPEGERHTYAQFEMVTGYMPPDFSSFWAFDGKKGLVPLSDGPGEQHLPVVLSTKDGAYAMGVYSPKLPQDGAGYGRFRFEKEKVVKWNAVYRVWQMAGIEAGDYRFENFVVVGTREIVADSLRRLTRKASK